MAPVPTPRPRHQAKLGERTTIHNTPLTRPITPQTSIVKDLLYLVPGEEGRLRPRQEERDDDPQMLLSRPRFACFMGELVQEKLQSSFLV